MASQPGKIRCERLFQQHRFYQFSKECKSASLRCLCVAGPADAFYSDGNAQGHANTPGTFSTVANSHRYPPKMATRDCTGPRVAGNAPSWIGVALKACLIFGNMAGKAYSSALSMKLAMHRPMKVSLHEGLRFTPVELNQDTNLANWQRCTKSIPWRN